MQLNKVEGYEEESDVLFFEILDDKNVNGYEVYELSDEGIKYIGDIPAWTTTIEAGKILDYLNL